MNYTITIYTIQYQNITISGFKNDRRTRTRYAPANAVVHARDIIGAELHAAVDADPALVAVAHVVVVIWTALTDAVVTALLAEAEVH